MKVQVYALYGVFVRKVALGLGEYQWMPMFANWTPWLMLQVRRLVGRVESDRSK